MSISIRYIDNFFKDAFRTPDLVPHNHKTTTYSKRDIHPERERSRKDLGCSWRNHLDTWFIQKGKGKEANGVK